MITVDNSVFVLVDVQERLVPVIENNMNIVENIVTLIKGLRLLDLPIIWLEQYPKGLGSTVDALDMLLADQFEPIAKKSFSGFSDEAFQQQIKKAHVKYVIVAGIEAHVCVYQTVKELLNDDYKVEVVADCISSRTTMNSDIGLKKMVSLGAKLTSVEMLLFELLGSADHIKFKEISALIK